MTATTIDRTDVAQEQQPSTGRRAARIGVTVVAVLALAAALVPLGANAAITAIAAHDHGHLDITIDGETIDLDQPRYHDLHPQFHVHEGSGNLWHHHPYDVNSTLNFEPMTLTEAFEALGMEATETTFTVDGTTYDAADAATAVSVTADGTPVDPAEQVITDGLTIEVDVETDG